jgi:hypothetical protein
VQCRAQETRLIICKCKNRRSLASLYREELRCKCLTYLHHSHKRTFPRKHTRKVNTYPVNAKKENMIQTVIYRKHNIQSKLNLDGLVASPVYVNERGRDSQNKVKPYEVGKRGERKGLPQEHQKTNNVRRGRGKNVTSYRYGMTKTVS